jgi:hypothetical protein
MGSTAISTSTNHSILLKSQTAAGTDTSSGKNTASSESATSTETTAASATTASTETTTGGGSAKSSGTVAVTGSSGSSKYYDPADTNKDGTVSAKEERVYYSKHPEKAAKNQEAGSAGQTYTRNGRIAESAGEAQNSFGASA